MTVRTDLDVVSDDLVGLVSEAMQLAHASLWLRPNTARKRAEVVENRADKIGNSMIGRTDEIGSSASRVLTEGQSESLWRYGDTRKMAAGHVVSLYLIGSSWQWTRDYALLHGLVVSRITRRPPTRMTMEEDDRSPDYTSSSVAKESSLKGGGERA